MMNRTWKSVFSVLLAVALLLPMVPAARAAGEDFVPATGVTLSTNVAENRIYWRSGDPDTITVTAKITPATYNGKIQWDYASSAPLKWVSETEIQNGEATITFAAERPVSSEDVPTVTAVVDTSAGSDAITTSKIRSLPLVIRVAKDAVNTSLINFSAAELSVQVGKTAQVTLNRTPSYPSGKGAPEVIFASSKPTVATVTKTNGGTAVVTGVKEGNAEISATVDGVTLGSKVYISVLPASTDLTGSATLGVNFSMLDIYDKLRDRFRDVYGAYPTEVKFPGLASVSATLRTKSGAAVEPNDPYTMAQLREMYLDPTAEGTFKCTAIATDGTNNLSAAISVTVSVPTATVRVPIDGSANYSFARASADTSGKTGVQLIKEGIGAFGSLVFGAVSSESSNVGALYTSIPVSNDNRVSRGTVVPASAIDELYFTPNRPGTYTVSFTAYSGSNGYGPVVCTGELILPVDGSSLELSVTLDSVKPYTFSATPSGGTVSLYTQILNAINTSVGGSNWGGIKFDGAASASTNGTLHESSAHSRTISASDYIAKSSMSSLYYVPDRSGTYEITYGVYANAESTRPIATGKLIIKTSTIPLGVSDITYTVSVKESVALRESDFIDFFQKENGSKYQLSRVVFNEYDGGGTFYHGTDSFLPYNSADFYSSTYSGSVPSNARYLDRLSFTAPSAAGYTAVLFTCYGGLTSDSMTTATTGKLCVFYTADTVPAVSYNAFNVASVSMKADGFVTAYNAAMKTSLSKPSFTIQLLNVPNKGTLYHYYSTGNSRRALTLNNVTSYTFFINDPTGSSVEQLSYEPDRNGFGTDEVAYMATSSNGTILYVGTIQFKLSSDLSLNVTNDGSNFQLSDFYNANDNNPVAYVTFPQPSAGKVYVYAGNRYIAAPVETKFYTVSSSDGQYPLTSAFYAPRANETGTVSLKCVLHRKSGATSDTSITLNVLSKSSSGTFGDVGGVTGWASNSIDFASKMGLVNGTQVNPPLFSPSNTMRRSDFVLMLYRLAGSPSVSGSTPYADVSSNKYYYNSAVWAYRNNIMRNVTVNNLYDPEGALTRQDFAQILFNYTGAMGQSTANSGSLRSYADASSVSSNTLEGVTWAVAKGYITSAVAGQLYIEPTRSATRAEISTLLHRYLTY